MTNQKIHSNVRQQQATTTTTTNKQRLDTASSIQPVPERSQDSREVPKARSFSQTQTLPATHDSESSTVLHDYPPLVETSGLAMVLACVQHCFEGRASTHQTSLLELSLCHIFISGDLLYSTLLSELTTATRQHTDDEDEHTLETMPQTRYCIWSLLQELEALFARMEPLCQLLNNATTDILEALDRSCSIYKHRCLQQEEHEDTERTAILNAIDVSHLPNTTYYQWMQAVRLLTARLEFWQQTNKERLLFSEHFIHTVQAVPALNQIDMTLDALLQTMCAVFGTILPEFHTLEKGDDETIAMLLLDLVQKTDQTLLYLEVLIKPLRALLRRYGTESTLQ